MQREQPSVLINPVSLLGVTMAVFSLFIIIVLLVLGTTGTLANPYTGILTFMVGPAVLALGLILIPIGAVRERRRRARFGGEAFPVLNLNDPTQRRAVGIFGVITAAIVALMATTTWGAAEYMESVEFCSDVCHLVMEPEGAAYEESAHARVTCVSCHIGPGAPWLVRSKISGTRQVINYTLNNYPQPIPVPIEDLRPSRDTCEECHWPERFYGDEMRIFTHFDTDEENTFRAQPLVFRVGGSELGHGIHWHTTAELDYLALNESRTEIGWLRVVRPDGSVDEYALPERQGEITEERIQNEQRFMDCIDCHNRTAHHFEPLEDEVDRAMFEGSIDPQIPAIKQQIMQAYGTVAEQVTQEEYQQTIGRIEAIDAYYSQQRPDVYRQYGALIRQAVASAKGIYSRSIFPNMNVTPATYPNWIGHDGCFRCHGQLVATTGPNAGQTLGASCLTCHYPAPAAPIPPSAAFRGVEPEALPLTAETIPANVPHPIQGQEQCTACHTPGGQGVDAPGGTGTPQDHEGRPDSTCLGCHAVGQGPGTAQGAPSTPQLQLMAVPHPVQGQEQCLTCHNVGGSGVGAPGGTGLPESHQGRSIDTCLSCHQAPAAQATPAPAPTEPAAPSAPTPEPASPAPEPTQSPAPAAPAPAGPASIPHPVQGQEQCTLCHTVGGPGTGGAGGTGIPADHQGRADATCTACHQPA